MYVPDVVLRNYSEKELFIWSSNLTGHPVFLLAKSGIPELESSTSFLHYTSSSLSVALSSILSHSLVISSLSPSLVVPFFPIPGFFPWSSSLLYGAHSFRDLN